MTKQNYKIGCAILFTFFSTLKLSAQVDTLIGAVGNQLIKINQTDGTYSNYMTINSFPSGKFINKLSWCNENQCFYVLASQSGSIDNQVSIIRSNGDYMLKGSVTIAQGTVYHIEKILYDARTNSLFASASLNGTTSDGDYESESLVKIDTATLQATVVGVAMHTGTIREAEFDNMAIGEDGFLYYSETQGPVNPFMRFYKQDLDFANPPILLYSEPLYVGAGDMTIRDNAIYFVANRQLRKIDLASNSHSVVGTVFSPSEFNGSQIYGLDWTKNYVAGILENANNSSIDIKLFPNPTTGILTFDTQNELIEKVEIFSLQGELVFQKIINEMNPAIQLKELSNGVYLVKTLMLNGSISEERIELVQE